MLTICAASYIHPSLYAAFTVFRNFISCRPRPTIADWQTGPNCLSSQYNIAIDPFPGGVLTALVTSKAVSTSSSVNTFPRSWKSGRILSVMFLAKWKDMSKSHENLMEKIWKILPVLDFILTF